MKKLFTFIIAALLFGTANMTSAQNLVLNPSFENWTAGSPDNWTEDGGSITLSENTTNVNSGSSSCNVVFTSQSNQYLNSDLFAVTPGDNIDVKINAYDNDAAGRTRLCVIYDAGSNVYGNYSSDQAAWQEITYTGTVPAGATQAKVQIRFYDVSANWDGDCEIVIDDVSFEVPAPASVEAPSFNPVAGTYFGAQDVTMTTATAGASIYYTTDGVTDPDNTSTLYAGPVNIASTTEIRAVAFDGTNYSNITTGVYTITTAVQVADMATLRAQADDNSTIYELTGEAFLTYQQSYRNKKYIQDATAGIEIDDPSGVITTTYNIYDGITGIYGKLNTYHGVLQFIPVMDPGAATSTGNTVTPLEITADEFNNNQDMYECRLVKINNLTFDDAGGTFATGTQYPTVDQLGNGVLFRTNFYSASYIGNTIPSGAQDITGIVYEYNGTPQFTARETSDFVPHAPVIPVSSGGIIIAGLLIAAVLVIRKGRLF